MALLIGTDEAGYGPNLGPLVITATAWRVPDGLFDRDLYDVLRRVVSRAPVDGEDVSRVAVADSKLLYQARGCWTALERAIFAICPQLAEPQGGAGWTWREIWDRLAPDCSATLDATPWYAGYAGRLPRDARPDVIASLRCAVSLACREAGVCPSAAVCRVIFPREFNARTRACGSKGQLLSENTLDLVRELLARHPEEASVRVYCDKHGGRNHYAGLLAERFDVPLVQVLRESRAESIYRLRLPAQAAEFLFLQGGERFLPAALASLVSKYVRELAMAAFNSYWTGRVAGLRPTAGYPIDARRFRGEIAGEQRRMAIDDDSLWRCC